jgi:large subunit ribosomal protein L4
MAQITVKNAAGKDAGKVELDDAMFGIEPNVAVMHQVVTAQLAARRSGTQSTKTRSEVRGGGAKPYRQKGTGNARQGSIRSPHFTGGGVALGPKPRKYGQKTPKKMVSLALRSALSDRANDGKVVVVDEWGWDTPSTKSAKAALAGLGIEGSVLIVVGRDDAVSALSFRNLPEVQLTHPGELSAYDVLCNDWVVFTESVLPSAPEPSAARKVVETVTESVSAAAETVVEQATEAAETVVEQAAETVAGAAESVAEVAESVAEAVAGDDFEEGEWAGSVLPDADGNGPDTHPIKGNADSMLYHTPESPHYKRTKAEVWFDTEENAEAAGFSKPASQQKDAD